VSETTSRIDAARRAVEQAATDGKERRVAQIDRPRPAPRRRHLDVRGHAAVFDSLSEDLGMGVFGGFREVIKRGAFKDAIKADDVRMLFNHNPDLVLARNTSGTLKLSEDPKGLKTVADIPDVSYARDLRSCWTAATCRR
jgi:phage head maturation protease